MLVNKKLGFAFAAVICGAASLPAAAGILSYSFNLEIESVTEPGHSGQSCREYVDVLVVHSFGCSLSAGNRVSGEFVLRNDPEFLANGIYSFLPLDSWSIRIGTVEWDINRATSDFSGFRDGAYCGASGTGFSQINPGLMVNNGIVTGFCGGVFGASDSPFIDFDYIHGAGRFLALDSAGFRLNGSYSINSVPEPSAIALFGLAMGVLAFIRRPRFLTPNV